MLATPRQMPTYTRSDFGDRTVHSLDAIIDDSLDLLNQSRAKVGTPAHAHLDILSAARYPHALNPENDSHHASAKRKLSHSAATKQLYGGLLGTLSSLQDSNDSSSAEREAKARPRKKARKSKKDDDDADNDDSKRQRGRPRLDTQDETAADRRRTQIRLAQRAYRHRKETTISALKKRVVDLQSTIDQMNKTFLNLHDNLIESGITNTHLTVARQLKRATEEFVSLARVSESDIDEENTKIAEITGEAEGSRTNSFEVSGTPQSQPKHNTTPQTTNSDEADVEELPLISNSFPYVETNSWQDMNNDILSFQVNVPQPQLPLESLDGNARATNTTLFPSIDYPLSSPQGKAGSYTYSFQETSFARRLHRRTLENGWRDLTNPSTPPAVLNRAFRFTFCFSNRKRIVQRFKDILQRRAGESLENWNVPFFRIGGAGTHFPRRDQDGLPIYPPNMLSPEKALISQDMGPHKWVGVAPETPRGDNVRDAQGMLESIGFGGEWFDSHDVEEFLKTKGIYLDGHSSFVEVDPRLLHLRSPAALSAATSNSTSPTENLIRTPSPDISMYHNSNTLNVVPDTSDIFTNQNLSRIHLFSSNFVPEPVNAQHLSDKDISTFHGRMQENLTTEQVYNHQVWPWTFNTSYPTSVNEIFEEMQAQAGAGSPQGQGQGQAQLVDEFGFGELNAQAAAAADDSGLGSGVGIGSGIGSGPRYVTLDVEQFLERMVDGAACLGRAPGFRKELVENALALSVVEGL